MLSFFVDCGAVLISIYKITAGMTSISYPEPSREGGPIYFVAHSN